MSDLKVNLNNLGLHSAGVARYMYENAYKYDLQKEEMYTLGLLHDVGKLMSDDDHENAGAMLMDHLRYKYAEFIAWHGTTPTDYLMNTMREKVPAELLLLWEADNRIDQHGVDVGYEGRLEDIGTRYGKESQEYKIAEEIIEYLRRLDNEDIH